MEAIKKQAGLSYYLGTWSNPYEKSRLIGSFTFFESEGQLQMSIENAKHSLWKGSWGTGKVSVHSYAPDLNDVVAFQARFHLDDMDVVLAINENKGLLVVASYFTFTKESENANFFVREFFHKTSHS